MLSQNTLNDVQDTLVYDFTYYHFETQERYERYLTRMAQEAKLLYMYKAIGETAYNGIAKKQRQEFDENEENLYWAEVYFICAEFMGAMAAVEGQDEKFDSESISVPGYSRSVTRSQKAASGKEESGLDFYYKAEKFLSRAGYRLNKITYVEDDYDYLGKDHFNGDIL